MYPVSTEFMEKMKSDRRRVLAKVTIDYTDPFLDQSIEVVASEQANVSYPDHVANGLLEPGAKYASLDGSWVLDGSYALAPTPEQAAVNEMGWWGSQLAGADGVFVPPYPTLTIAFAPRPITKLQVVGDSKRQEWPVDFVITIYNQNGTVLYNEVVTGNNQVTWSKLLDDPVTQATKMELSIQRWSHPGRQVKITEFFTSIQETYEGEDIISINLLEEREVSTGSLPVGNISSNEIDIKLNNESRKFDAGNTASPLHNLLKPNRRIRAWLGIEKDNQDKEWVPLGVFWSGDWRVPEDDVYAQTTGRDRLELLRKSTYSTSEVLGEAVLPSPTFSRDSVAYLPDGTQVAVDEPRFEDAGLSFDGVDDFVDCGNDSSLDITDDLTIEILMKADVDTPSVGGVVKGIVGGWASNSYGLRNLNNNLRFYISSGSTIESVDIAVPKGEICHIAGITSRADGKLYGYLNYEKVVEGNRTIQSINVTTGPLNIGRPYSGGQSLKGNIYEVRIWNRALTKEELLQYKDRKLTGNETGLVAYYKFNEGTGTIAHDSTANANHGTIYGATWGRGKLGFGKAVMVEEGTTNLFTNPKLLNNGQDWTPYSSTAWVDSSGEYPYMHCEAQFDGVYQTLSLSATTYTLTYLVKHKSGSNLIGSHFDGAPTTKIRVDGGEWIDGNTITVPSDGNWHLVEIQATYTTAGSYKVYLQPGRGFVGVSEFWFKYAQLEQKPYHTSFIDGTRSPETLTIPTAGVLNPQEGTIEIRCMKPKYLNYNARVLWAEKGSSRFGIHDNSSGGLAWAYSSTDTQLGAGQLLEGQWHYLAMSWNRDEGWAKCYVDGNHIGTIVFEPGTNPGFVGSELLGIGSRPANADLYFNGFFDELRISNIARTDEEILQAYQSNKPAISDIHTTYLLRFDGNFDVIAQTVTLYDLAKLILQDAGLTEEEYYIDTELKQYPVPYAYFEPQSHREALRKVAEACLGQVYCDRRGVIRVEGTKPVAEQNFVTASEKANISYPSQVVDGIENPDGKYASLDGSWELDGSFVLAPETEGPQMGWWGKQLSGPDGSFAEPYPTLTVTFLDRAIEAVKVVGDSARGEYPVDFTIRVFDGNDNLLSEQKVTGNAQVATVVPIPENPTNAAKIELSIQKWSHPGRQAKILEFLNKIYRLEISPDDYFSKDNPPRYAEVANYIVVETQPVDSKGNKLPGVKVIAKDDESITENGLLPFEFPANPLVQTVEMAEEIAGRLLEIFKDPRRNLELDWRGNPAVLLGDVVSVVDSREKNDYKVVRQEIEYTGALYARLTGRRL